MSTSLGGTKQRPQRRKRPNTPLERTRHIAVASDEGGMVYASYDDGRPAPAERQGGRTIIKGCPAKPRECPGKEPLRNHKPYPAYYVARGKCYDCNSWLAMVAQAAFISWCDSHVSPEWISLNPEEWEARKRGKFHSDDEEAMRAYYAERVVFYDLDEYNALHFPPQEESPSRVAAEAMSMAG